jgi:OOP family OmpA-OmpF porin
MKKNIIAVLLLASGLAQAHDNWISQAGPVVNSTGLCWRDSAWTPATAAPECDGALKPVTKPASVVTPPAKPVQLQPTKPVAQVAKVTYAAKSLFDFDRSVIKPEGQVALNQLVAKLKAVTVEVVIVVGHTDSVGTDDYNLKLGMRRAEAVKKYLASQGVELARVYTDSKGESQPIASNKTAQGRSENRRVVVEVYGAAR